MSTAESAAPAPSALSSTRRAHRTLMPYFLLLVAHALTYVAINTGFALHAYVLFAIGSPAIRGAAWLPIDPGWLGAALAMPAFWGIGLLLHGFGALMSRGFEASA